MLADAQAVPSLRPEIKWAARPQFREAVAYQPLHWFNGLHLQQVQRGLVKNRPNIQQGDMLIHFAGLMGDKREFIHGALVG